MERTEDIGASGRGGNELRDERLSRVYGAKSAHELTETYDEWAADYEGDMLSLGHMVPAVAAGFTAQASERESSATPCASSATRTSPA